MLLNYLKVAFRNLKNYKGYTFINISGLAVGLACCFLIGIYLNYEFSFEDFHENKEEIYRIIPRGDNSAQVWTPSALSKDLLQLKEIENATRIAFWGTSPLLHYEENPISTSKGVLAADSSFFEMFSYPLVRGNPSDVLDRPFEVVISESIGKNYFKGENPVGKIIRYNNEHDFVVTGVMEDMPQNSHISNDFIFSFQSLQRIFESMGVLPEGYDVLDNYSSWNYSTYVLIPDERMHSDLEAQINAHIDEARGAEPGTGNFTLQPLGDIHFDTGIRGDTASGNLNFIYAFSAVAVLILVIAGFNFINLTTARSLRRAKEVGVRKSLGADQRQLIYQFVGESLIIGLSAVIIALVLVDLFAPRFANILNSNFTFSWSANIAMAVILILAGLAVSIISSIYPAFYLSGFNPINALKDEMGSSGNSTLRKVLTGLQFGIASVLIVGTLTVIQQMRFMETKDLGFDKSQVINLNPPKEIVQDNFEAFKSEIEQFSFVETVSRVNKLPGTSNSTYTYEITNSDGTTTTPINTFTIDPDFVDLLDLNIVKGRNLSWDRSSDIQNGYLVNETAVRVYGLDDSGNVEFRVTDGDHPDPGQIVGVVEDFHYNSLHQPIEPLVMYVNVNNSWNIGIEVNATNMSGNLEAIKGVWNDFAPAHPFTYSFLDNNYEQQYRAEQNFSRLLSGFTIVGIIIACLGLYGLTSFMVARRTKEIGIRKVLGASVKSILGMLSTDFAKLVLGSFVIVIPLAYWSVQTWLQNFAYRIDQSIWIYLSAAGFIMVLALLTVSYQTVRAAFTNPVEVLKDE